MDARTDLWSLGVVLYEMLSGQVPFRGGHESAVIHSILHDQPRPPRDVRNEVGVGLERVLLRALEKDRQARFDSAEEFARALGEQASQPEGRAGHGRKVALGIAAVLLLASAGWVFQRSRKIRWAREEGLPEVLRLVSEGSYGTAYERAREVERYIPTDPLLMKSWPELSTRVSIEMLPEGADVYFKHYEAVDTRLPGTS